MPPTVPPAEFDHRRFPGAQLLPASLNEDLDVLGVNMAAAYEGVKGDSLRNFAHWHNAQTEFAQTIFERLGALGLEAPPWHLDGLRARLELPGPAADHIAHLRLLKAFLIDYTPRFWAQFDYRRRHGGNVHGQVVGPTGFAKSSCLGTIADAVKPIQRGQLISHIAIDPSELPDKLKGKLPGDTVWLDELLALSGEGSSTLGKMLGNLDDTLRASGVDLWYASPKLDPTATTQVQLEAVLWSPPVAIWLDGVPRYLCRDCDLPSKGGKCSCGWQPWTLFLVWVNGVPMGLVGLPRMPDDLYQEYAPWKKDNTERLMRAIARDRSYIPKQALKLVTDPHVIRYLSTFDDAKPRIGDFGDCVNDHGEGMLTGDQQKRIAQLLMRWCLKYGKLAPIFEELYGFPAPAELKALAAKWEGSEL